MTPETCLNLNYSTLQIWIIHINIYLFFLTFYLCLICCTSLLISNYLSLFLNLIFFIGILGNFISIFANGFINSCFFCYSLFNLNDFCLLLVNCLSSFSTIRLSFLLHRLLHISFSIFSFGSCQVIRLCICGLLVSGLVLCSLPLSILLINSIFLLHWFFSSFCLSCLDNLIIRYLYRDNFFWGVFSSIYTH